VEAAGTPAVLVSFGSPYLLESLPSAHTYLVAWGPAEASQRAAADAVLGRSRPTARLPISLPPYYATGYGLDRAPGSATVTDEPRVSGAAGIERPAAALGIDPATLERLDRILETATADGLVPGAALAVGRSGGIVRLRGYGRLDPGPESAPVTPSTLYDLASLTKVVGTTTAAMRLVDQGRLALDDRVGDHLPEWSAGWLGEVTIRHLLTHTAGLPPFRPFWREHEGREAYRAAIAALEPASPTGTETVYSDIGLMALGFVIEEIAGRGLDEELAAGVFGPLGMEDTGFRPDRSRLARIAPTEMDTVFRHRHVRGEVHDENAFALGGVAGHAGLFSTADDLARFARWMLRAARADSVTSPAADGAAGAAGPPGLPRPETVRAFTRRADPGSSRALGWDTPAGLSSSGRFTTPSAFGHTGFTGTSIWIDPELDIFVVLLTNRVNPTRANALHAPLRRAVHDAALAAIADRPVVPRPEEPEP
jgi:CubicO group peptidase (beta-lactamase class C family)